jgi:hypothetical protein
MQRAGLTNASADFEELGAQGFDLGRAPRLRQLQTKEVDQAFVAAADADPSKRPYG